MNKQLASRKDCTSIRQKLSAFADGEVSTDWREKIEAHLAICPDCRQALFELRSLWQALEDPLSAQARPGFTQDVLRKINGGTQAQRHDWSSFWGMMFPTPASIALVAMLGLALGGWLGHSLVAIDGQPRGGTMSEQSMTLEALDAFSPMPKGSLAHGYLTLAGEVAQ